MFLVLTTLSSYHWIWLTARWSRHTWKWRLAASRSRHGTGGSGGHNTGSRGTVHTCNMVWILIRPIFWKNPYGTFQWNTSHEGWGMLYHLDKSDMQQLKNVLTTCRVIKVLQPLRSLLEKVCIISFQPQENSCSKIENALWFFWDIRTF